jgi:membrane fusion protein, multidrug efflux system
LPSQDRAEAPFRVQVARFTAEPRTSHITVRGHTEASKRIEVRTRTQGIIEESPFSQGDAVRHGDLLCRLDLAGRKAQLQQAKAQLASAEQDYEAARTLRQSDFVSESKLAAERARLDLARAQLDQIELDIGWTEIKAPADGVLAHKPAEVGNYLEPGAVCASLSVLDPSVVVAQIGERHVAAVHIGTTATARLATGETVEGTMRFIAPSAELATRTFRIELEVANADHSLREGVTAELIIALPDQLAHKLPSSALTLSDQASSGCAPSATTTAPASTRSRSLPRSARAPGCRPARRRHGHRRRPGVRHRRAARRAGVRHRRGQLMHSASMPSCAGPRRC